MPKISDTRRLCISGWKALRHIHRALYPPSSRGTRYFRNMDAGESWADQWDNQNPDPLPPNFEDKSKRKGKSGKDRFSKMKLSLQWVKELCKKPTKR